MIDNESQPNLLQRFQTWRSASKDNNLLVTAGLVVVGGIALVVCCVCAVASGPNTAKSTATPTKAPTATATQTPIDTPTATITNTPTLAATPTISATPTNAAKIPIVPVATKQPATSAPVVSTIAPTVAPIPPTAQPTIESTVATARHRTGAHCVDGSSSGATGSGACSKHGGVSCWYYSDGTCTTP